MVRDSGCPYYHNWGHGPIYNTTPDFFRYIRILHMGGAQDGDRWNGRVCVGSAENENLEKLKLESSLGEVTER